MSRLGHLTMYPVASTGRTKGQRGTEADLSQIDKAIDVAVRAPELVTYDFWSFIENGANYEPVKRGMPPSEDLVRAAVGGRAVRHRLSAPKAAVGG